MDHGICAVTDCPRAALVRGWCNIHYQRWYRWGDPTHPYALTPVQRLTAGLVAHPHGCLVWTGYCNANGYGVISAGRRTPILAHRLAWSLAHPGQPLPPVVRHSCDNPPCCNPAHLLAGTVADNSADAVARDRMARAERHPGHKLTQADVAAIRAAYAAGGVLHRELAAQYGVSRPHISAIIRGEERAKG